MQCQQRGRKLKKVSGPAEGQEAQKASKPAEGQEAQKGEQCPQKSRKLRKAGKKKKQNTRRGPLVDTLGHTRRRGVLAHLVLEAKNG